MILYELLIKQVHKKKRIKHLTKANSTQGSKIGIYNREIR